MSDQKLTQAQKDALIAGLATGLNGLTPEQERMLVAYYTDVGKEAAEAGVDLANAALDGVTQFLNGFFARLG